VDNRRAVERKPSRLPLGQFSGDAPSEGKPGVLPVGQFSATLIS